MFNFLGFDRYLKLTLGDDLQVSDQLLLDAWIDIIVCHEGVIVCPTSILDIIQTVLIDNVLMEDILVSNIVLTVEHTGHLHQVVF